MIVVGILAIALVPTVARMIVAGILIVALVPAFADIRFLLGSLLIFSSLRLLA